MFPSLISMEYLEEMLIFAHLWYLQSFIFVADYTQNIDPELAPYSFIGTWTCKLKSLPSSVWHPNEVKNIKFSYYYDRYNCIQVSTTKQNKTYTMFWGYWQPPKKKKKVLQRNYKIIACFTYLLVCDLLDHPLEGGEEKERRTWQLV